MDSRRLLESILILVGRYRRNLHRPHHLHPRIERSCLQALSDLLGMDHRPHLLRHFRHHRRDVEIRQEALFQESRGQG